MCAVVISFAFSDLRGVKLCRYEAGMERLQAALELQTVALDSATLSTDLEDEADSLPLLLSPSVTVRTNILLQTFYSFWAICLCCR